MPTETGNPVTGNPVLDELLRQVAAMHRHLCPRQVLGVRMGICAARLFPVPMPQKDKRMMALVETDGCFADGVTVATGCSMGHRTMWLKDEGKVAVTMVDTHEGRALRYFPLPDLRRRAIAMAQEPGKRWHAYLEAYRRFEDEEMFGITEVRLNFDLKAMIGRPGTRAVCERCGEEIINQREVVWSGTTLCRSCAGESYWSPAG